MIYENTKETQRSITGSYTKDIICKRMETDWTYNKESFKAMFNEVFDIIQKKITQQKITTNQKTKIFALMDLKKIASKEDLTIRKHLDDYTLEDAGYLIEKLATEVYGSELPPDMQDYLNTQKSVMEAVKSRVQRDGN